MTAENEQKHLCKKLQRCYFFSKNFRKKHENRVFLGKRVCMFPTY